MEFRIPRPATDAYTPRYRMESHLRLSYFFMEGSYPLGKLIDDSELVCVSFEQVVGKLKRMLVWQ